jgi:hypothetical protein
MQELQHPLLRCGAVMTGITFSQNFVPIDEIPIVTLDKHFFV